MVKNSYKAIGIISLQFLSHNLILYTFALLFPYLYQDYWKPHGFVCPEGSYCIIDDFRTQFDFFFTFFGSLISLEILSFVLFRYWLSSLKIDLNDE